jgi:gamma-glutamylaminecyclotransferase
MKVFVYGTLKKGFGNHARLLADAPLVGVAMLSGNHTLLDSGFPVCLPVTDDQGEGGVVLGEVYSITEGQLARLDRLENEGRMYHRMLQPVVYEDGTADHVWVYIGDTTFWKGAPVGEQWRRDWQFFVYDGRRPGSAEPARDEEEDLQEIWELAMEADMARMGLEA